MAVVNPWRVRRLGEGVGILVKPDAIDARLLAEFGEKVTASRATSEKPGEAPSPTGCGGDGR